MKKLFTLVSVIVVLSMLLAACAKPTAAPTEAPVATEAPTEAATPEPTAVPLGPVLKIGMISSVSGAMALYSLQQQRGFDLGLEYASGGVKDAEGRWVIANRPVEVILKDDELNAEKGVALARELIEKDAISPQKAFRLIDAVERGVMPLSEAYSLVAGLLGGLQGTERQ